MPNPNSVPVRQDTRPGPLFWPDPPFAMRGASTALLPAMDLTESAAGCRISIALPGMGPARAAERTIQISAA